MSADSMEAMHSLLKRQLKRHLGDGAPIPEPWRSFINAVNDAYRGFDADRAMLEHSLELSSQELLEANSELRAVVQAIPDLVLRLDPEGTILDIKAGAGADLMLKRRDLMGKRIQEGLGKHIAQQFTDALHRVVTEPSPATVEYSRALQGQDAHFEARLVPLPDGDIVAIIRDITAQKQAQADLRRLAAIIESSSDAIIGTDLDGVVTSWNLGAQRIFGYSAKEMIGTSTIRLTPFERWREEDQLLQKVRRGEVQGDLETLRHTRDGRLIDVCITISTVREATGHAIGFSKVARDITRRKRAEAALAVAHQELVEASRQAGRAEIAANVLHNVGNVLNSVNISASVVSESVRHSKAARLARVVSLLREHESDLGSFISSDPSGQQLPAYLAELSDHFLADESATLQELDLLLQNIEHIKHVVATQQIYPRVSGVETATDIREVIEDALRMNVGALDRYGVTVVREFAEVPPVHVDKHKVLLVLVNLIRNAELACHESGRPDKQVTLRVTHGGGRIKLCVIDNGVGIPPENLTRIFNHGFTTRKTGHGYGLHSCALAAKQMGGTLTANSDGPGKGAQFTLELPVAGEREPA